MAAGDDGLVPHLQHENSLGHQVRGNSALRKEAIGYPFPKTLHSSSFGKSKGISNIALCLSFNELWDFDSI